MTSLPPPPASAPAPAPPGPVPEPDCPNCLKPQHLCVCEAAEPIDNRLFVLVLEHPQEKRELLGTAPLVRLQLNRSLVRVGLSWPSLTRILDREVDPKRWGVLYLGAQKPAAGSTARAAIPEIAAVDKSGQPLANSSAVLAGLEGIIVLDGTWSQAKSLWWRNAWLLKCRRIVLHPPFPSLYGQARREPRKGAVSTLEAAAFTLAKLHGDQAMFDRLMRPFALLLQKMRPPRRPAAPPEASPSEGEAAPAPTPAPASAEDGQS